MENIFLNILNMSITASFIVLAIVLLRLLLKKAPKSIMCLLWILVAVRLVCPFSFESILSLIPSTEPVPPEIVYADIDRIGSSLEVPSDAENNIIYNTNAPESLSHMTNMQIITLAASILWIVGIAGMLVYALISYLRIRRKVRVSMLTDDNIYLCDHIDTPFILGIFKPRIYLPSTLPDRYAEYVIAHEKAHLKRKDHLWKPIGFLLLSVYWFNPILWLAYILLCRDIELACDEKVIKEMGEEYKKDYSSALLSCSVPRRMISACPLAFGETDVKRRIKTVLNYKKPAFWIIIVAIITCIAVAVCFLTNPISNNPYGVTVTKSGSDYEGLSVELKELELGGEKPYIDIRWKNKTDKGFTCGEGFTIYKVIEGEYLENCRDSGYNVIAIGYHIPAHGTFRHEYGLSVLDISEPGTYRFVSGCSVNGGEYKNYDVWVEFEIKKIPTDNATDSVNNGSSVEGISAELVHLNLTDESSPYIEIKWTNKTNRELISGEEFYIYKYTDGELKNCREGEYFWHDIGYIIPANGSFTHKYSLYNIDLSEAGKYRFEAPFSGGKEKVWVEFEIGENGNLIEDPDKEVSVIYYYEDSEKVYKPHLRLSTKDNRFEFTLSGLSSYYPMGTYRTKDGVMTLTADDGNRYVFNVIDDDTLEFVADKSADIPKYRYSSDEPAKHPFPDGAHFERKVEEGDTPTLIRQTRTSKYFPQELPYSYDEIIEMTIKAFPWERGDGSAAIADLPASSYMYRRHSDLSEIGYALIDLDNYGHQELVIAPVDGTYVYDLYTIKGGKTVQLFSSGERYSHSLYENGYISLSWSGGAALSGHDFYKLTDSKLKFLERVTTDVYYAEEIGRIEKYTDAGSDNTFFRSNSERTKDYVGISDKEALEIINSYKNPKKELRIKYTPLSEYNT